MQAWHGRSVDLHVAGGHLSSVLLLLLLWRVILLLLLMSSSKAAATHCQSYDRIMTVVNVLIF